MTTQPTLTNIFDQLRELKEKRPDVLHLFRVGEYYVTCEQDAVACADILGVTLLKKSNGTIPYAAFPASVLDVYLPKLIRAGRRVAIVDKLKPTVQ